MSSWRLNFSLLSAVLCLTFGTGQASGQQAHASPMLNIDGLGKGWAPIDGAWQFHLGDDPSFADPAIDDAAGHNGWEEIQVDRSWSAQSHPGYNGFAWYRRHLRLTPVSAASQEFAILVWPAHDVYEVYWNGVLIGRDGKMPPQCAPALLNDRQATSELTCLSKEEFPQIILYRNLKLFH